MRPETEGQLADLIRGATAPLSITGGGTRPWPGEGGGTHLDMTALTGVTLYEPEALTLVVRAGTPLETVRQTLTAEGQMLAFEPVGRDGSTIGGVAATNASGPRRVQAGAARDAMIGVRFVDGQGEVIRNGGRVMKNVTGYDLVKLMAGSRGRLGALSEISFRTAPLPPVTATLALPDLDAAAAIPALSDALGGPFDVSGAAWLPGQGALIRLEGLAASVKARAADLGARLAPHGRVRQGDDATWHLLHENIQDSDADIWRITCRPSEAPAILSHLPEPISMDWGGALIHVRLPAGQIPDLPRFSGHARRIAGAAPALRPAADPLTARLEQDLQARFDPRGIFGGQV
ncbi:FAD-binding protein [Paracoccus liaowanqingii]|uniref:FAD-binding protein n=1 Tax=Paracoccus liaowanqingii TaxID=2560053 RepID=A0A4Z1CC82_9RHOB|nr:FAD-binding protein [Paracoccus liaowanqingii]TGN60937.1 FAD-binding protein [Paracoccus liaowanqingii]